MMYLVLTALLALQVNSAILLKFKFIDDSLTDVNGKTDKAADGTVEGIKASVAKNRNQANDLAVLKKSEEIRDSTKQVIAYLNGVRERLLMATENGKGATDYKNMSAEDKVAITMLGGKQNGLAYPLQKRLNGYSEYIKQFVPEALPLALNPKEDARIAAGSEQKNKSFAELNFENTPVVAALAVLSQKETEVLKYQADALQKQAEKVGAKTLVFDKLGAFASAESNTVAAGTKYKADLFLTASASGIKPTMTYNGSPLAVGP
ncbi:MAG: gliding motility protein GldM, partial [Hymenobacter sp.]